MKKNLLFGAILMGGLAIAQTRGAGVETDKPTETLHVEGTARVTELPVSGEGKIYTKSGGAEASTAKDQPFGAVKTLVVNEEGVLGVVERLPASGPGKYENEDGTELYVPEKKCVKTVIGDGHVPKGSPKVLRFNKPGYMFSWYDSGVAGKFNFEVQRTPEYAHQPMKAKSTWWFSNNDLYGAVRGDFRITASPEKVFDASFQSSSAGRVQLIIQNTAQTFLIDFATLNQDGEKVMNVCVEQTVF